MFGPATTDVQRAILALMEGRGPSPLASVPVGMDTTAGPDMVPLAPAGGVGALDMDTSAALAALQPQPVPPSLPGPVDAEGIRSQFAGMAGPEPVAPTMQPTSMIIRIARALQGFGAGVQGQGPQFLAQIAEQREAPQREYRARKERFDTRKQELGVMAERAVLSAEEKRAARTQELLDRQFEQEFQKGVRRLNLQDEREQQLFRDALLAKRQREDDERQAEENRRKEGAQKTRDSRIFAKEYRKAGAGKFAKELADYDAGLTTEISPGAVNWESAQTRIAELRAGRLQRGASGSGASSSAVQNTIAEFETLKNLAIQAAKSKGGSVQDEVEAVRKATAGVVRKMARQPNLFEVGAGSGGYLYAKPRQAGQASGAPAPGPQPQEQMYFDLSGGGPSVGPAAQQLGPTEAEVTAYAQRFKISPEQARRELMGQ